VDPLLFPYPKGIVKRRSQRKGNEATKLSAINESRVFVFMMEARYQVHCDGLSMFRYLSLMDPLSRLRKEKERIHVAVKDDALVRNFVQMHMLVQVHLREWKKAQPLPTSPCIS